MSQNPTLTVYTGPMFSQKTTRLLLDLERFKFQRKKILVFKPAIDDRYSSSAVVSHSGWRADAITVKEGSDILEVLMNTTDAPDVIAVDEAFMIAGVADVLIWLYRTGISVVVSSLDLGYQAKPFKEIEKLLPWATHVVKCTAVCTECGRDAFYTHKKTTTDKEIEDGIEIGGDEMYEPRCFRHHLAVDNRPKIHDV